MRRSSSMRFFVAAHEQIGHAANSCQRAGQCSRPKKMICRCRSFQDAFGKMAFRSRSVRSTVVPFDSPHRAAKRWMWVSTGKVGHDHACGFVADPGEVLKRLHRGRDLTSVPFKEQFREPADVLRFRRRESDEADAGLNLLDRHGRHAGGIWSTLEERGRHFVHLEVGRLGGHQHRHKELEGGRMVERYGWVRIHLGEHALDALRLLRPSHGGGEGAHRMRFRFPKTRCSASAGHLNTGRRSIGA
jgi:hypothetical protein